MFMKPVDTAGILYSQEGLRFGGYPTDQFMEFTESMEEVRPWVRDEIVGEAHHQVIWLHVFAELGFLAGIVFFHSLVHAIVLLITCYFIEYHRVLGVGVVPLLSRFSSVIVVVRWLLAFASIIAVWSTGLFLTSVLVGFAILQFRWTLITMILVFPFRVVYQFWARRKMSNLPDAGNHEAWVIHLTIQRWRRKLSKLTGLVGQLQNGTEFEKQEAARKLHDLGEDAHGAVPHLVQALTDESSGVRAMAAFALGGIGPSANQSVRALKSKLADECEDVREWAAISLAKIDPTVVESVPILVNLLRSGDRPTARGNAATALGRLGKAAVPAIPLLSETIYNEDFGIRMSSFVALEQLASVSEDAIMVLREATKCQDESIAEWARSHLATAESKLRG